MSYAQPLLIAPDNNASIGNLTRFKWYWDGSLGTDEWFDVRVWREREAALGVGWTKDPWYDFDPKSKDDDNYLWTIVVIRGQNGQWMADLSDPATPRQLNISGGNGGSDSENDSSPGPILP